MWWTGLWQDIAWVCGRGALHERGDGWSRQGGRRPREGVFTIRKTGTGTTRDKRMVMHSCIHCCAMVMFAMRKWKIEHGQGKGERRLGNCLVAPAPYIGTAHSLQHTVESK